MLISKRASRKCSPVRLKISPALSAADRARSYSPSKAKGWIEVLSVRPTSDNFPAFWKSPTARSNNRTARLLWPLTHRTFPFARSALAKDSAS